MRKLVLFMHISLDGFTANSRSEIGWVKVDEEMFDYAGQRTNNSDLAIYGRGTYKIMEDYWPTAADKPDATKHDREHSAWYNKVAKIVVSRTMKGKELPNTRIISDNLPAEIRKIKEGAGKEIIMFGSPGLAHSLIKENLIDNYWLFVNPIILGQGIPLFPHFEDGKKLKLIENKTFKSGVVCLHYETQR